MLRTLVVRTLHNVLRVSSGGGDRAAVISRRIICRNWSTSTSSRSLSKLSASVILLLSGARHKYQSNRTWTLMAMLPAAFFGLWKTEEDEMSIEDKILMDIKRAILSIQRDQIEKAEKYLSRALAKSREEKLEPAISQILDIQANLALQKGELAKAEKLLKMVAQRLIGLQGYARNDNSIIEMSIKLAQVYEKTGHLDNAISGYEYCIQAQKDKIKNNEIAEDDEVLKADTLLLLAWAQHSLGQLHLKLAMSAGMENLDRNDHVRTATTLSTEAYKFTVEAEGPESEHAITIQSDLATIEALTGDIDSAIKSLHEVEIIAKEKHTDLCANISVNIGNLYLQKGSYSEAEKICQAAKIFAAKMNDKEALARAQECVIKCAKLKDTDANKSNQEQR